MKKIEKEIIKIFDLLKLKLFLFNYIVVKNNMFAVFQKIKRLFGIEIFGNENLLTYNASY